MSSASELVLGLANVPLDAAAERVAERCIEILRPVLGPVRLVLPPAPLPLEVGDPAEGLQLLLRFVAVGGEAEVWAEPQRLDAATLGTLGTQLERIWTVQRERAAHLTEQDRLRFHLAALQQVAHTLAIVRGTGDTEQLALDSVKEVFFAWWAGLYRSDPDRHQHCRAERTLRGEVLPRYLPADVVRFLVGEAVASPVVPAPDDPLRQYLPADLGVVAPLDLGDSGTGLLVLGSRMTGAEYDTHDLGLLRALADASAIAIRNADLVEQLRTQAMRDALTGCQNRRGFDERILVEFSRARRYGRTLSLMLLDLDFFKKVNDDFGHDVGDHALRQVGRVLTSVFRVTDSACRVGGEEFAMIFPETPKPEAIRLAERLRATIEVLMPDDVLPRALTASVGVAAFPDDSSILEDLVRVADRALYRAKAGGRNRVEVAPPIEPAAALVSPD